MGPVGARHMGEIVGVVVRRDGGRPARPVAARVDPPVVPPWPIVSFMVAQRARGRGAHRRRGTVDGGQPVSYAWPPPWPVRELRACRLHGQPGSSMAERGGLGGRWEARTKAAAESAGEGR
jgi:hypothetical protein